MYKFIFFSVSLLFLSLNASSTFNGQRIYLKECRVCHMGSRIFLNMHTNDEWKDVLDTNGSSLSNIHISKSVVNVKSKDGNIKDSHSYFKSEKYKKQYIDLKNFIVNSTQDSDNNFYSH